MLLLIVKKQLWEEHLSGRIEFEGLYKKFPGGVTAVSDFNLDIKDKEFIILVGPSVAENNFKDDCRP